MQKKLEAVLMSGRKMGNEFSSWSLLPLLLLFMCAYGNGARELNEKHMEGYLMNGHEGGRHDHNVLKLTIMDVDNKDDLDVHTGCGHDHAKQDIDIDAPHHDHGIQGDHHHTCIKKTLQYQCFSS